MSQHNTLQHTTSVSGSSFMVENLAVEILCFWSICSMCHTKQSYFWFHSRLRKCWLSHSSLKFWWRIIMNWITAPYYSCVHSSFSVFPSEFSFTIYCKQFPPGKFEDGFSILTSTSRLMMMYYVSTVICLLFGSPLPSPKHGVYSETHGHW